MKTPLEPVSVTQVNHAWDIGLAGPDELLDRYATLTGWSEALCAAGAGRVTVVQRFRRDARRVRNGVEYRFVERDLSRTVGALAPDIVHVNGLEFPLRTWALRRALPPSAAIVVQSHADGGAIGRAPLFRLAGRAARGAVDAFLFAADAHAASWRDAGFIAPDQRTFTVMPASTTFAPLAPADARRLTGMTGSPAVLWVGRLTANKDPLTVLDAFERNLASWPSATLTMIFGTSELIDAVRACAARLGDRVRLVGAVRHDEMPRYFSAADLFVVGSHHEGSGYGLMEALACGATPVVTDIPSFQLLTVGAGPGGIGALWRAGDAADCARAMREASRDTDAAARARVRDRFMQGLSWSTIGRRALAIYGDVAGRRRQSVIL